MGKIDGNFVLLLIEKCGFFCRLFFCPCHHFLVVAREICQEIIVFSEFFINAGRSFSVRFTVRLCDINIFIAAAPRDADIHSIAPLVLFDYVNKMCISFYYSAIYMKNHVKNKNLEKLSIA